MLYDQLARNRRMTVVLFVCWALVVLGVAWALDALFVGAGPAASALIAALIVAVALSVAWFAADRVVLSALRARPPRGDDPAERNLDDIVAGVALAAGLPAPRLYVVDDPAPNAFATGRSPDKGVVVFTSGLLEKMSRSQVEAVAAHELSHVANRDAMIGVLAAVLVGVIVILSRLALRLLLYGGGRRRSGRGGASGPLFVVGLALLVFAPLFAALLRFAISRRRESLADANAVRLTRNPDAMIGALQVLDADRTSVDFAHGFAAHLWIEQPQEPQPSWLDRMFSTHPPIAERIRALRAIAGDLRLR